MILLSRRGRLHHARHHRRGFAVAIVLWAVALSSLALSAVQFAALRASSAGREAVARTRATWAARAGIESMIADLQAEQLQSQPAGSRSLLAQLQNNAEGTLYSASFKVVHQDTQGEAFGPTDAASKININRMTSADLMLLPDMTEDVAEAILDWIDADEDIRTSGGEVETYSGLRYSYKPRNGPIRDLRELELIKGVLPEYLRGEDWNLNGILDPNENDGDASWPPDNADGALDAGWSKFITATSVIGGNAAVGGGERLDLTTATSSEIVSALGVDDTQAQIIAAQGASGGTDLSVFITQTLSQLQSSLQQSGALPTVQGRGRQPQPANLTSEQLGALLEKTSLSPVTTYQPGKINLNTVEDDTLQYLAALDPTVRENLIAFRESNSGDILHISDLLQVDGMTNALLAQLYAIFDVHTTTLEITSRGKDEISGIEVEITAVVDRSADPVVIRSMLVR